MAAILGQAFEVARDVIARDHIEHQVDALATGDPRHFGDEIGRLVVNRMRRTQFARRCAFCLAPAGYDDPQAEQAAKADRHGADAAGAAVDQDRLALARPAALKDIVPDGKQRFGQRRRLSQGKPGRDRQAVTRVGQAIFAVTAARYQRADLLAVEQPCVPFSRRHDSAGNFEAGDRRGASRRWITSHTLRDIGPVDPGEGDFHQHLASPRARHGQALRAQNFWAARRIEADCRH